MKLFSLGTTYFVKGRVKTSGTGGIFWLLKNYLTGRYRVYTYLDKGFSDDKISLVITDKLLKW